MSDTTDDLLNRLAAVIEQRRTADPDASYVAALFAAGRRHILDKIEEESAELVDAAERQGDESVIHETADLWFHSLVLLAERGLHPAAVLAELERRFGVGGLVEKAARDVAKD